MATNWVLDKISGALQPTIQSTVSTAGSYAGGALNTVGNGINGIGQSINGTVKRYGDGVRDYGNGVMDWANAPGTRGQTASNPLGLSSGKTGGKSSVTSPSIYSAPAISKPRPKQVAAKPSASTGKATQAQKKIAGAPVKKTAPTGTPRAVNASQVKKTTIAASAKPQSASKGTGTVGSRTAVKPAGKPTAVAKSTGGFSPVRASTTKAKPSSVSNPGKVGGSNPLGLSG